MNDIGENEMNAKQILTKKVRNHEDYLISEGICTKTQLYALKAENVDLEYAQQEIIDGGDLEGLEYEEMTKNDWFASLVLRQARANHFE